MYTIYLDDKILYYPGDELCAIIGDPVIKLAVNQAGSCELTVPPSNPCYDDIQNRKSMITAYRGEREVFCGEVREVDKDRWKCKKVYAVGELAYLADGIQPQYYYGDVTPLYFLDAVLTAHNQIVEPRKQFTCGTVTVSSGWDESLKVTDRNNTLDAIRAQLIENLGGCLRIRKANGIRYLDYVSLSDYGVANQQGINFGENLMDYSETMTASDVVTCIVPLGKRTGSQGDFDVRVDIKSVNSGKDYLTASQTVLNRFGNVWRTVIFDDLEEPLDVKDAGADWLTEKQYETLNLRLTAVDLSELDADMDQMNLGDRIPCRAEPYGLVMTLPIIEQTLHPLAPQKDTIVLSATIKNKQTTISTQVGSGESGIQNAIYRQELKIKNVIRQESANLMARFAGTNGGYKLSEFDSNGLWLRDLYMDSPDKETATNILEISMNGIRSSTSGYKPATDPAWKLGITIDGQINADRILTGTLMAGLIKAGVLSDVASNFILNMETGAVTAKQMTLDTPYLDILPDGTIVSKQTKEKLEIKEALQRGYYSNNTIENDPNPTLAGLLDLSADYGDGTHRVVLESKNGTILKVASGAEFIVERNGKPFIRLYGNDLIFEGDTNIKFYIGSTGSFEFWQNRSSGISSLCGFIDGNGWHGATSPS